MKSKPNVTINRINAMICEELSQSQLSEDIARTRQNCAEILSCFSRSETKETISHRQRKILCSALQSTISHVEFLLKQAGDRLQAPEPKRLGQKRPLPVLREQIDALQVLHRRLEDLSGTI